MAVALVRVSASSSAPDRVPDERRADAVDDALPGEMHRADRDAGVDVAVEQQRADGAAVPAARARLQRFDDLGGLALGRAGQGHGPHMRQERVEPGHAGPQAPLDMVDRVEQAGIGLDLAAGEQLHRAGPADARLVVAVDIGAHRQLDLVLLGVDQRLEPLGILHRAAAAPRGAGDRAGFDAVALDPHEHLRRGADELLVAELDQELVRAGIDRDHLAIERRRRAAIGGEEAAAEHDLENVADAHALARRVDQRCIAFRACGPTSRPAARSSALRPRIGT